MSTSKPVSLSIDTYLSLPFVGRTVISVRRGTHCAVVCDAEIASHIRCWDRRRAMSPPPREPLARGAGHEAIPASSLASLAPRVPWVPAGIARRRIDLDGEVRKLSRLSTLRRDRGGGGWPCPGHRPSAPLRPRLIDQSPLRSRLGEPPEPSHWQPRGDSSSSAHDFSTYDASATQTEKTTTPLPVIGRDALARRGPPSTRPGARLGTLYGLAKAISARLTHRPSRPLEREHFGSRWRPAHSRRCASAISRYHAYI